MNFGEPCVRRIARRADTAGFAAVRWVSGRGVDWLIAWNADIAGPGRESGRYLPAVRRSGRIATRYGSTTALLEPAPVPATHSWHHRARLLCGHKYGHPDFVIILSIARYFSHINASTERKRSAMDIIYTDEKRFTEQQVEHLFLSV